MTMRDNIKNEIDILPDAVVERIQAFISFQKYSFGISESDAEYLSSIPGMMESIKSGVETPISECVPLSEVWADV